MKFDFTEAFKEISLNEKTSKDTVKSNIKIVSFNEAVRLLNLEDENDNIHDLWIKWHNNNNEKVIERIISNKKYRRLCQLKYFFNYIIKESNCGLKCFSTELFEEASDTLITLWRGGSGIYNSDYDDGRDWVSFTALRRRANTFSKYSGTNAQKVFELPTNDHYWIVELNLKLKDILAYYDCGDAEVIVSAVDSKKATVVEQV